MVTNSTRNITNGTARRLTGDIHSQNEKIQARQPERRQKQQKLLVHCRNKEFS